MTRLQIPQHVQLGADPHFPAIPGCDCRGFSEVFWVAAAGADGTRRPPPARSSSAAGVRPPRSSPDG